MDVLSLVFVPYYKKDRTQSKEFAHTTILYETMVN